MVFYSGAKFCTDLCGDGDIQPPLHDDDIGADGCSNHTQDALGCPARPILSRTTSGSALKFRPFRDHKARVAELRSRTPELLEADSSEDEMSLDVPLDHPPTPKKLQPFDASGLGGTQPADHFAVQVETRRVNKLANESAKATRFSGRRTIYHTIPKSTLNVFSQPSTQLNADSITRHLASLAAFSSPSPGPTSVSGSSIDELPIQTEFVSIKIVKLEPSPLPPPLAYYGTSSSSEDDYESSYGDLAPSSSANISDLRGINNTHTNYQLGKSYRSLTDPDSLAAFNPAASLKAKHSNSSGGFEGDEEEGSVEEDITDDEDEDSEIDMLAHERRLDPESVKRKEMEFEMARLEAQAALQPRSSVAAVAESESDDEVGDEDGESDGDESGV
jgi:hypothetical protein